MSDDPNRVVEIVSSVEGGRSVLFFCPGCNMYHSMLFERGQNNPQGNLWNWNGDVVKPTLNPSLGVNMGTEMQCHLFVRDGKLEYLGDSVHALRGQTVPMLKEDLP